MAFFKKVVIKQYNFKPKQIHNCRVWMRRPRLLNFQNISWGNLAWVVLYIYYLKYLSYEVCKVTIGINHCIKSFNPSSVFLTPILGQNNTNGSLLLLWLTKINLYSKLCTFQLAAQKIQNENSFRHKTFSDWLYDNFLLITIFVNRYKFFRS